MAATETQTWGANSGYGLLRDVLLCRPDNLRWLPTSSISKATLGFTVYDPDVTMFTLGGGGVHCMCQSLRRDPV